MISIDYFRKMESSIVEMAFYEITFSKWSRTAISKSTLISHLLFYSSMCESIEFLKGDHWGKEIERGQPYKTGYAKLKD